jgi:hypothetical protein
VLEIALLPARSANLWKKGAALANMAMVNDRKDLRLEKRHFINDLNYLHLT